MLLKNTKPRLITINTTEKVYDLKPAGDAVDVPNEACNTKYVKHLIAEGSIIQVGETIDAEALPDGYDAYEDMTKAELTELAESSGVEVGSRMNKDELIRAILDDQE